MSTVFLHEGRPFPSVLHVKRGEEVRRYIPERTCRIRHVWNDPDDGDCWTCEECGELNFSIGNPPKYCQHCGAKVVSDDADE